MAAHRVLLLSVTHCHHRTITTITASVVLCFPYTAGRRPTPASTAACLYRIRALHPKFRIPPLGLTISAFLQLVVPCLSTVDPPVVEYPPHQMPCGPLHIYTLSSLNTTRRIPRTRARKRCLFLADHHAASSSICFHGAFVKTRARQCGR